MSKTVKIKSDVYADAGEVIAKAFGLKEHNGRYLVNGEKMTDFAIFCNIKSIVAKAESDASKLPV